MTDFIETLKELEHRHQQPMPFSVRDALLALSARIDAIVTPNDGVPEVEAIDEPKRKGKKSA